MNSRQKGKRGELELAAVLRAHGYSARRGQQYAGANGDADVVGLPGVHIECKRVERLNLDAAMAQAVRDARAGEVPVVMHRRNRGQWMATLRLEDFLRLEAGRSGADTKRPAAPGKGPGDERTACAAGADRPGAGGHNG